MTETRLRDLFVAWFDYYAARATEWLAGLTDDEYLWKPMGPEDAPYADDPVASFIEHIHDEFIHHTAEIALLRDLYRSRLDGDG